MDKHKRLEESLGASSSASATLPQTNAPEEDLYGWSASQYYEKNNTKRPACSSIWYPSGDSLYIQDMTSRAPGGGSETFREILTSYFRRNLTGEIWLQAATTGYNASPLLFYLYMGMIPYKFDIKSNNCVPYHALCKPYLRTFYHEDREDGKDEPAEIAYQALRSYKITEDFSNFISTLNEPTKEALKFILHTEKSRWGHKLTPDFKQILIEELIGNKELLLDLMKKEISELETFFIPAVLQEMRKNLRTGEKIIDFDLTAHGFQRDQNIRMHMSETGFKRWKEAIENNQKFEPFKRLEHLPLSFAQRDELWHIMQAKAKNAENKSEAFIQYQNSRKNRWTYTPTETDTSEVKEVLRFSKQPYCAVPSIQIHADKKSSRIIDDYDCSVRRAVI